MLLTFWQVVLDTGEEMTGSLDAQNRFTGTIRDPKPGFKPHWVIGSCTWNVTGQRVGGQ